MLHSTTLEQQYKQTTEDNLRILIVGAGIAGITAAQMLRKDGRHPVLIERNRDNSHPGYMLALMPMVDAVLDDLAVRGLYRDKSVALDRFSFHTHKGKLIREDSMTELLNRYGDYRGVARGELLDVLTSNGCHVSFDTQVVSMGDSPDTTLVTLKTGNTSCKLEFDAVIVADGLHSSTRDILLGAREVDVVDTKWGGWVVWAPEDANMDLGEELWGAGFFLGIYPVKGRLGVFLGGAREHTKVGPARFAKYVHEKLTTVTTRMESCLESLAQTADPYYWSLSDCRSPQWALGRKVLLGDAAAGFLPTAGIGAGMAMESAWVLTRMLRYAKKENVIALLDAYEKSQRPRVEAAQKTSRELAGMMFHQSGILAMVRDLLMRVVSVKIALRPIQKLLVNKPDPDTIAGKVV